jgi:VanZ family protein
MKSAIRWIPAVAWMGLIFWLSSGPLPSTGGIEIPDKVAHLVTWMVLGALLWWASAPFGVWRGAMVAFIAAALYGAADEVHQRFVPGRSADVADWLADVAGSCVALVLITAIAARRASARRRRGGE